MGGPVKRAEPLAPPPAPPQREGELCLAAAFKLPASIQVIPLLDLNIESLEKNYHLNIGTFIGQSGSMVFSEMVHFATEA